MPNESMATKLEDDFGCRTYVPQGRLKLFKAMVAASQYEKEQAKIEQ